MNLAEAKRLEFPERGESALQAAIEAWTYQPASQICDHGAAMLRGGARMVFRDGSLAYACQRTVDRSALDTATRRVGSVALAVVLV